LQNTETSNLIENLISKTTDTAFTKNRIYYYPDGAKQHRPDS